MLLVEEERLPISKIVKTLNSLKQTTGISRNEIDYLISKLSTTPSLYVEEMSSMIESSKEESNEVREFVMSFGFNETSKAKRVAKVVNIEKGTSISQLISLIPSAIRLATIVAPHSEFPFGGNFLLFFIFIVFYYFINFFIFFYFTYFYLFKIYIFFLFLFI